MPLNPGLCPGLLYFALSGLYKEKAALSEKVERIRRSDESDKSDISDRSDKQGGTWQIRGTLLRQGFRLRSRLH